MNKIHKRTIKSWGNFFKKKVDIYTENPMKPYVARGSGLSYNDAAFSKNVFKVTNKKMDLDLTDPTKPKITVGAAVTLDEIISFIFPKGFFLPVVPGTKYVTIGGCVAANIHGKNHHVDGSFCDHVNSLFFINESGEEVELNQGHDQLSQICGSMGLLGTVTKISINLVPIKGNSIFSETIKTKNLKDSLHWISKSKNQFNVAWIDMSVSGDQTGRGVVIEGEWTHYSKKFKTKEAKFIPRLPSFVFNPITLKIMSRFYYTFQNSKGKEVDVDSFFFPLDKMKNWDNAYGEKGMIQFQCVFPDGVAYEAIEKILKTSFKRRMFSFITVLKRFGTSNVSNFFYKGLNFHIPNGITLAMDVPANKKNQDTVKILNELVAEYGGRVYLAKDSLLEKSNFEKMYNPGPFLEAKKKMDPSFTLQSSLWDRLMGENK